MCAAPSSEIAETGIDIPAQGSHGLGHWSLYFLVKLALFWQELIGFHPLENLAFACALLVPIEHALLRKLRALAAWPMAVVLLYYDSWLPPLARAFSQASLISNFSLPYLLELGSRFVSWPVVSLLVIVGIGYALVQRWLRIGVFVVLALVGIAIQGSQSPSDDRKPAKVNAADAADAKASQRFDPEQFLRTFFAEEAARSVAIPSPAAADTPFDVIFLQICSLSWDDLKAAGLESHPLLRRFDVLLTRFNSAASYSGPAAIRIQRATCGQQPHDDLYKPARAECYLMENLHKAGFTPAMALNHDGHFDDFLKVIKQQTGLQQLGPMPLDGIKVAQYSFDGSPIYDDGETLSRWLGIRKGKDQERAALYYNSISLHDGNRMAGERSSGFSLETYPVRLRKLLDDLDGFMQNLEKSGRRAVVVMIPEHGAALRGDKMQIAGLREVPSPAITLVPVGIKVIGPQALRDGESVRIDTPTSYLAVSEIIARMIARSPFVLPAFSPADYTADLPGTAFVANNAEALIVGDGDRYYLKQGSTPWTDYKLER